MAFPTTLTNAIDYTTIIMAAHLNNLEAKVGIDSSAVVTSLDYLVKNTSSIDPGHKHSKLWASDGSPEAVTVGATGIVTVNVGIVFPTPFTLGAISVTTTGTRLNYLTSAAGTTGTVSTNLVFSTSPTLTDPVIANISPTANFTVTQNSVIPITSVAAGALVNTLYLGTGNVGVGVTAWGTNAVRVVGIGSGTAPTTSPADAAQIFVADRGGAAGTASVHIRNEDDTAAQSLGALYGSMYSYENATATAIGQANVYHGVVIYTTSLVKGFTYKIGSTGPIASFATHSGGAATLITDVGHGLVSGEVVTISNSTNYNGAHVVTKIDNDTYTIPVAYVAEAGGPNWIRASSLQANAGSAGVYHVNFNATIHPEGANNIFKVEINIGTTAQDHIAASVKLATAADYAGIAASGLLTIADGDYIWLSVKNQTDATDITVRHANLNLIKV